MSAPSLPRRTAGVLLSLLAATSWVVGAAGTAHAEDGYRYWNYSHLEGDTFAFAQTGPADHKPKDGDVEGWRYGTSTVSQGIYPRADLGEVTFDAVCAGTEAAEGEKRVAVLVDFGTEADANGAETPAPRADCAVVPANANGQQVLDAVVAVRTDNAMVCALDGYPAQGCGDPVANAKVSAEEETVAFELPASAETEETDGANDAATEAVADEDSGISPALVAVLIIALVLAALAIPLYRRKRDA